MSILKQEQTFCNAHALLRQTVAALGKQAKDGERIDVVERGLFDALLAIGLELLTEFVALAGDGDEGEKMVHEGAELKRLPEPHARPYRSIFGRIDIRRRVYGSREGQKIEWVPLDAQLGLPAGEQSYVLEDWLQRFCVKQAFKESVDDLRDVLGIKTSVRAAERMNRDLGQSAEPFFESQPAIDGDAEQSILVITADGKGVPMRRGLKQRMAEERPCPASANGQDPALSAETCGRKRRKRLGRGEKRTRKQMAFVGAVYSIAPFVRTAADVLDDLRRHECQQQRPRPANKRLWAEMTHFEDHEVQAGQPRLFAGMALHAAKGRRPLGDYQAIVCLMDGQISLWNCQRAYLGRAIPILDIFHVNERLWQVAHCFHKEKSPQAEAFVEHHLKMILEGNVTSAYGQFQRLLNERRLPKSQRDTVNSAITYLRNNRNYMRYNEYLAAGYPIGSGVAEGACRHHIKDRMEQAGMRWEIEGARPMVQLRAIYLNGLWDDYIEFRILREQAELYGQAA